MATTTILTLRRGESPRDAQTTHTPTGHVSACRACPAPSDVPGLARRARRSPHAGARAWPLVHGAFVLVPTGPASRGTPNDASGGQGHRVLGPRCAPADANNH